MNFEFQKKQILEKKFTKDFYHDTKNTIGNGSHKTVR